MTSEERLRAAAVTETMPSRRNLDLAQACRDGADALALLREALHFLPRGRHADLCAILLSGTGEDGPTDCDCGIDLVARIDALLAEHGSDDAD